MAVKYHGMLNLSRIPKDLITQNKRGESVVWIDVVENRVPGKYGETHSVSIYNRNTRQSVYIADLKPQEFGASAAPQPQAPANSYRQAPAAPASAPVASASASSADGGDLPFS